MATKIRTAGTSLDELMRRPAVAAVEPALRRWVEESLADAAHPVRGRSPKGLGAVLARQLERMPAAERSRLVGQVRRPSAPARSLSDHLQMVPGLAAGVAGRLDPLADRLGTELRPVERSKLVRFEMTGVDCIRTTREVGADELYGAGFVGGPVGQPVLLPTTRLGEFRNGDAVTFPVPVASPGVRIADADGFQSFLAVTLFAEVDDGAFFDFVTDSYQTLLDDNTFPLVFDSTNARQIERLLWVGLGIGAGAGALIFPVVGIPLLAAVVAGLIARCVQIRREDELFTTQIEVLDLLVDADNPPPAQNAPVRTLKLLGYGANYSVRTRWRIG